MTNLITITKILFIAMFMIWFGVFITNHNYASLIIFAMIFIIGFFIQKWKFFWRICFVFFSVMSMIFLFGALGGLEPDRQGILSDGNWFTLGSFLFLISFPLTLLSLFVGIITEKRRKSD